MSLEKETLAYHEATPKGKIGTSITKTVKTSKDLSLAYTPGVAIPCEKIQANPLDAYKYTNKGNLVAVISNGTAVLGLGDIGALASKPVMEGKALLFKYFGGVDSFDIEIDCKNVDKMIEVIRAISPSFGGINLEDIKAPECFEIEEKLIELLDIPVFHDDQHGTAIVTAAGMKNALEIQGKTFETAKIVVSGAGSAAIAVCKFLLKFGVKTQNIFMFDTKGLLHTRRTDLNAYKKEFAHHEKDITLVESMKDADVFIGLSVAKILSKEMVSSMAPNAIIFAMTNPTPEIMPEDVLEVRSDIIVATGRSDYPNQVNNSVCFPYLFRGALDVGAKKINDAMKIACANVLAEAAKLNVPRETLEAYGLESLSFGKDYIMPKQLDKRLLGLVAPAVAKAAVESGVATRPMPENYKETLEKLYSH